MTLARRLRWRTPPMARRRAVIWAVALVVAAVTGLVLWRIDQPGDAVAGQRAAQTENGPAVGLTTYPVGRRPAAPALAGETLDGSRTALKNLRGHVVVLNVWGSWCMPCRKEAPDLARAARETSPQGVRFVGIDTRDNADAARAFVRTFKIPYPSLIDRDGQLLLAFNGVIPVSAVPSTVVVDRDGRIAARVIGRITYGTLRELIDDVRAESRVGAS